MQPLSPPTPFPSLSSSFPPFLVRSSIYMMQPRLALNSRSSCYRALHHPSHPIAKVKTAPEGESLTRDHRASWKVTGCKLSFRRATIPLRLGPASPTVREKRMDSAVQPLDNEVPRPVPIKGHRRLSAPEPPRLFKTQISEVWLISALLS